MSTSKNTTEFGIILLNKQFVPSSDLGLGRPGLDGGRSLCNTVLLPAPTQPGARPFAWELLFTQKLKTKSKACKYLIGLVSYCLSRLMCEGTPCVSPINSQFSKALQSRGGCPRRDRPHAEGASACSVFPAADSSSEPLDAALRVGACKRPREVSRTRCVMFSSSHT